MQKPFLTYDQLIALLRDEKGLAIHNEKQAREILSRVGYYSLICGYKYLYKNPTTHRYKDGVSFDNIVALYRFDAVLRSLFLRYLLMVERAIKAQLSYSFCERYGEAQSQYLRPQNYDSKANQAKVRGLISILNNLATQSSDYPYINHQRTVHHNVPLWVLVNAITFGQMSKMFGFLPQSLQSKICRNYPLDISQMKQILSVISKYRNVCAHGERLYSYRTVDDIADLMLHAKMGIPKKGNQYEYGKKDLFAVVISLRYLLPTMDFLEFKKRLAVEIDRFIRDCAAIDEETLLKELGFPPNWKRVTSYKMQ